MDSAFAIRDGWVIDATRCVRKASTETIVWSRVIAHRVTMPAMRPEDAFAAWGTTEIGATNLARRLRSRRRMSVSISCLVYNIFP